MYDLSVAKTSHPNGFFVALFRYFPVFSMAITRVGAYDVLVWHIAS